MSKLEDLYKKVRRRALEEYVASIRDVMQEHGIKRVTLGPLGMRPHNILNVQYEESMSDDQIRGRKVLPSKEEANAPIIFDDLEGEDIEGVDLSAVCLEKLCAEIHRILDDPNDIRGVSTEPWQSVRVKLYALKREARIRKTAPCPNCGSLRWSRPYSEVGIYQCLECGNSYSGTFLLTHRREDEG